MERKRRKITNEQVENTNLYDTNPIIAMKASSLNSN